MTNKKITPVTFSDESVGVKHINRVAPVDPDSGSGSGSGSGDSGSGELKPPSMISGDVSASTNVSSRQGCSWRLECSFSWHAQCEYATEYNPLLDEYRVFITSVKINIPVVTLKAVADGVEINSGNKCYVSKNTSELLFNFSYEKTSLTGIGDFVFSIGTTSPMDFPMFLTEYNSNGIPSSTTIYEKRI